MSKSNKAVNGIYKALVYMAKRAAGVEANSTCRFWGYQPKEPNEVKKLRKF